MSITAANVYQNILNTGQLAAGTYFITGRIQVGKAATGATNYTVKLFDGVATNYASAQVNVPSLNPHQVSLVVTALVVLAVPTTVQLAVAASTTGAIVQAAATANAAGNTVTSLHWLKVA